MLGAPPTCVEMAPFRTHENCAAVRLVEARTRASSACEMACRRCQENNDFTALAAETMGAVLKIVRRGRGVQVEAALGLSHYDALLRRYEPGGRSARVDALFRLTWAPSCPDFSGACRAQRAGPQPLPLDWPSRSRRRATLGEDDALRRHRLST